MIYWFTGQPGSGKTTLAIALKSALQQRGRPVVHLDSEFLRELVACSCQNPVDDFPFLGRTDQSLVQPLKRIAELMSIQAQ